MEEFFDTFDLNGNFLGVKPKSFCHSQNPMCYHNPFCIWIIRGGGRILVQKRASTKKKHPNKWDMPSAGHVNAGESILQGCVRETKEELGLVTKESDYIFLKEWLAQSSWELAQVYLLKTDADLKDFTLQKEEVAEVQFLPYDQFEKLFYSDEFVNHSKEYKDWVCKELKKHI